MSAKRICPKEGACPKDGKYTVYSSYFFGYHLQVLFLSMYYVIYKNHSDMVGNELWLLTREWTVNGQWNRQWIDNEWSKWNCLELPARNFRASQQSFGVDYLSRHTSSSNRAWIQRILISNVSSMLLFSPTWITYLPRHTSSSNPSLDSKNTYFECLYYTTLVTLPFKWSRLSFRQHGSHIPTAELKNSTISSWRPKEIKHVSFPFPWCMALVKQTQH